MVGPPPTPFSPVILAAYGSFSFQKKHARTYAGHVSTAMCVCVQCCVFF